MASRLIAILLLCPLLALAGESSPELHDGWNARLERAGELQAQGKTQQDAADRVFEEQNQACYKKFLVNACLKDNKLQHAKAGHEAQRLVNEGKAQEREVRKEQLSDKDARRNAEASTREADLQAREREIVAERAAREARAAQAKSDKARKADEGARRKLEAEEKHRRKVAEHDAKIAARQAAAERRSAEAQEKH